ncbi:MAG: DUF2157 domain-containing protein [Candidatus Hydrogenedentes bacterium]|nr:DUF2157 domain-containing protein [Candidatus Hydrogenedentota bacterium]
MVAQSILSADAADRLHAHYGELTPPKRRPIAIIVLGLLGATLIGLGIILVLAHNWEFMSRYMRTAISIGVLLIAQAIAAWVMIRQSQSIAWREGAGTFLMAMIGTSIALIAQTYHLPSDMDSFLLTWMLLSAPIVYLLDATLPAILYLVGITSWAGHVQSESGHAAWFWLLALLATPHAVAVIRRDPDGPRAIILAKAVCLCLTVATGVVFEKMLPGLWIVMYSALFGVFFLVGTRGAGESRQRWQVPMMLYGAVGTAVLSLALTFPEPWHQIGWRFYHTGPRYHLAGAITDYVVVVLFASLAVILLADAVRRHHWQRCLFGVMPLLAALGYAATSADAPEAVAQVMFNLYLAILGVVTLVGALHDENMVQLNFGLAMLAGLITARFFDTDLDFVVRGVAFILIGIGFLSANLILLRRRSNTREDQP